MTERHARFIERQYRILDIFAARSTRSGRVSVYGLAVWLVALLVLLTWATGSRAIPAFRN